MKPNIYYTTLDTFDSDNDSGFSWTDYLVWSKFFNLKELVSLDGTLNRLSFILNVDAIEEWNPMIKHKG